MYGGHSIEDAGWGSAVGGGGGGGGGIGKQLGYCPIVYGGHSSEGDPCTCTCTTTPINIKTNQIILLWNK